MKFTLKACLFLVASLFLTTLVSGLPQQDTKDEGSKTEQKKPVTKEPRKGTINPIEQGGTAATAAKSSGSSGVETTAAKPAPGSVELAGAKESAAKKSAKKKASKAAAAPPQ